MSSHREAPEIAKDPVADSTDLYAFVSPDAPDTVTLIANYVPLQSPSGGPNFYEFGDDVLYEIHVDNDGDGNADVTYQFRFKTELSVGGTFLYNVGPITALNSPSWNRKQFYSVTRIDWLRHHDSPLHDIGPGRRTRLLDRVPCPPCNIGPLSTPNYVGLANAAVKALPGGGRVFAGQRREGFYVDLGSVFDLGNLRPFQQLHAQFGLNIPELTRPAAGVNATKAVNVHSIVLQLPKAAAARDGAVPTDPTATSSVVGVWTTASRQKVLVREADGTPQGVGPFEQVSRLGNPLFNEVLVPMERKDYWNRQPPSDDKQFAAGVANPELASLLPVLYPGVFPNLAALNASKKPRADLLTILLTGIPAPIVSGFQNFTGATQADLLRLNVAIPPKPNQPSNLGFLGGDVAGYPNGRRVFDDVFTIELRAIAGVTYALVDKTFTPDAAAVRGHRRSHHQRVRPEREGNGQVPADVPVPRHTPQRLRDPGARRREHMTGTVPAHRHHHPLPPSGPGTVVLDIGGSLGALVVHTPATLAGLEIELARRGETVQLVHTEVRERRLPGGSVHAAVFAAVPKATTRCWTRRRTPTSDVVITSGRVTELHW